MKSRSTEFEADQMPASAPELSKSAQGAPSTTARSRRPRTKAFSGADQLANAPDEKFYTVEQVAEDLNVSPRTVRRWIQSKALVAHRFGTSVRAQIPDSTFFVGTTPTFLRVSKVMGFP